MPWLSRSNSPNRTPNSASHEDFMRKAVTSSKVTSSKVTFIPSMLDGSCGTSPIAYRQTPTRLLWRDFKVIGQNLDCLPEMARSLCSWSIAREVLGDWRNARDVLLQIVLVVVQIFALFMAGPVFLAMPGAIFVTTCLVVGSTVAILSLPLKGQRVFRSGSESLEEEFYDERWIHVNGSMTSHYQLRSQLCTLSSIFGRPITGVHNRTNGPIADLLASLLSHSLNISTPVSTTLYTQLREALLSPSIRKVVVLGHGTGAHLISVALDRLHADLSIDVLSKLEIYTFGSAATHLSNPVQMLDGPSSVNGHGTMTRADGSIISPVKAALAANGYRLEDTERVIPHCEHYALSTDLTALSGIVHHTRQTLDNRFCGRLFLISSPGFLFSQYLNSLFPSPSHQYQPNNLLDEIVSVDVQTAEKREFTAQGVSMPLKTLSSSPRNSIIGGSPDSASSSRSGVNKRHSWQNGGLFGTGMDCIGQARNSARECEGKSVRQLSRLWRYVGGGRPVGEGVSTINGVGNGVGLGFGVGWGNGGSGHLVM